MQKQSRLAIGLLLSLVAVALHPNQAWGQSEAISPSEPKTDSSVAATPEVKVDLRTLDIVDEQLFMIRKLEHFHSMWPTGFDNPEQLMSELLSLRHQLVRSTEYAKAKNMDARLVAIYQDSIKIADEYGNLLSDFGVINKNFEGLATKQALDDTVDGATSGFSMGSGLALAGVEPITATVVIGGLAIKQAFDTYQQQNQLEGERAATVQQRVTAFLVARSHLLGRIEIQTNVLAEDHDWPLIEVGFDEDESETQRLALAIQQGDFVYYQERASNLKQLRPRDPFVFAASGELNATIGNLYGNDRNMAKATEYYKLATKDYIDAVKLTPSPAFHDELRAQYILEAATNGCVYLYYADRKSTLPVYLADTALKYRPRDPDGQIRYVKAFALSRCGAHNEAISLHRKLLNVRGATSSYYYDAACIESLAGRPEDAIKSLRKSLTYDAPSIRAIKTDKDLSNVRQALPNELKKLLKAEWDWHIDYGSFWNNVVFKNIGPFPLSQVAIRLTWADKSGAQHTEVFWIDESRAGHSTDFEGAFDNSTNERTDFKKCSAKLNSNELRSGELLGETDIAGSYSGLATQQRVDRSSVMETRGLDLQISTNGAQAFKFSFSGGGSKDFELTCTGMDNCFISSEQPDASMCLYIDKGLIFGWYQAGEDVANGDRRVVWLDKREPVGVRVGKTLGNLLFGGEASE